MNKPPTILRANGGQRVSVHVWAKHIDHATERQLRVIASQPYVLDPVCAMADAHLSNHVAVGTVFATTHTVVPDALGGDLGCGIAASSINLCASSLDLRSREKLLRALQAIIPVGDRQRQLNELVEVAPSTVLTTELSTHALTRQCRRLAALQYATLGGGNHFVELGRSATDQLWVLVHSGSRGVGAAIAEHHRAVARSGQTKELGGLDVRADQGAAYWHDLQYAMLFAQANREAMLKRVRETIARLFALESDEEPLQLDVSHNTIGAEEHHGQSCLVHRKGATPAQRDQLGIIPGSMGTATYLVRGKGNAASWCSCSHGAGRVMSRREAHAKIKMDSLKHSMRGVVFDQRISAQLIEEAPQAYRDIREVISQQADLVTPVLRLEPILSLKG